jgi:hypothetical protein
LVLSFFPYSYYSKAHLSVIFILVKRRKKGLRSALPGKWTSYAAHLSQNTETFSLKTEFRLSEYSKYHPFNITEIFPFSPILLHLFVSYIYQITQQLMSQNELNCSNSQKGLTFFHKIENIFNANKINLVLNRLN